MTRKMSHMRKRWCKQANKDVRMWMQWWHGQDNKVVMRATRLGCWQGCGKGQWQDDRKVEIKWGGWDDMEEMARLSTSWTSKTNEQACNRTTRWQGKWVIWGRDDVNMLIKLQSGTEPFQKVIFLCRFPLFCAWWHTYVPLLHVFHAYKSHINMQQVTPK